MYIRVNSCVVLVNIECAVYHVLVALCEFVIYILLLRVLVFSIKELTRYFFRDLCRTATFELWWQRLPLINGNMT